MLTRGTPTIERIIPGAHLDEQTILTLAVNQGVMLTGDAQSRAAHVALGSELLKCATADSETATAADDIVTQAA